MVLFSPESLNSIKEGSSERRDLVDQFLLMCPDLNYQRAFDEYSKVLKSKNKVLKSYVNQTISRDQALHLLASYEKPFLLLATELTHCRIRGLNALSEDFKNAASLLYHQPVDISVEIRLKTSAQTRPHRLSGSDILSSALRLPSRRSRSGGWHPLTVTFPHCTFIVQVCGLKHFRFQRHQKRSSRLLF